MAKGKCLNPEALHLKEVPADYDGAYELHAPYYKQGDDLNEHMLRSRGVAWKGIHSWAQALSEGAGQLRELAVRLKGLKIDVEADTHFIRLIPRDKKAAAALRQFAGDGLLYFADYIRCEGNKRQWEYIGAEDDAIVG